ncbi:MAG: response regulator transcription factor [Terracidiphilus sp.]|jgi:DNA-binding response OmpR family regulator
MRILIIEDELRMLELLRKGLYEHGFAVETAADGETGLETAMRHKFDVIVLDIGLPKLDGYGVMQSLRLRSRTTPVLMLTARDTEDEIIRGLGVGADDYLTKPFSFPELVARLQSITRHDRPMDDALIEVENVVVNLAHCSVTRDKLNIELTRLEYLLLICLMRHAGLCVQRQKLMEFVWGPKPAVGAGTLDVLVNSLRTKFDAPYKKKLIGTVRGSGYVFRESDVMASGSSV